MSDSTRDSYDRQFFETLRDSAKRSAAVVVPLLMDLLRPASVVDVGCGTGTWLGEFMRCGIHDIHGVDGAHVEVSMLEVPAQHFQTADLTKALQIPRTFDVALCLEVAEHLPPSRAAGLIADLVALAPVIAFSAAIPHQGGTHHVNEQWPEYWVEHFSNHGFVAVDAIRPQIWDVPDVAPWYAQNTLLFVRRDMVARYPGLDRPPARLPLRLVHPRAYEQLARTEDEQRPVLWRLRHAAAERTMDELIRAGHSVALADNGVLQGDPAFAAAVPFLERDGMYWGAPSDSEEAIRELERMRTAGATCLVLAWPAFWWTESYPAFIAYLRTHFAVLLEDDTLLAFDLR